MKAKLVICMITFSVLCSFMGCKKNDVIFGKIYKYEGEGFGGDFTIEIKEDGSFEYYAGGLSSYVGIGNWSVSGDTLMLKDNQLDYVNYFKIDENSLVFMENNSTNFMYVTVKDGENFTAFLSD